MPLMTWTEKMSVGIGVIDTDHQKLVSMVNELYDGIQAGKGKEKLGSVLDALVDYTKMHFAREEKFFAQTAYPEAAAHQKEHAALTKQVADVQGKFKAGATSTLSLEVMNFLKNWLITHIQGTDKKCVPHLHQKGVK